MIRILLAAALVLGPCGHCLAQTPNQQERVATQALIQRYTDRLNVLLATMRKANSLGIGTPPATLDLQAIKKAAEQELARSKQNRPAMVALAAELDALPALPPSGYPEFDSSIATGASAAREMIERHITMMDEIQPFFVAIINEDRQTVQRLAPRLGRLSLLSIDSGPVTARLMKASARDFPDIVAYTEAIALMGDGAGVFMRMQLGDYSQPDGGQRLADIAKKIRVELLVARSGILKDARAGGDSANVSLFTSDIKQQMQFVLEQAETYAAMCDEIAALAKAGQLGPQDVMAYTLKIQNQLGGLSQAFNGLNISD